MAGSGLDVGADNAEAMRRNVVCGGWCTGYAVEVEVEVRGSVVDFEVGNAKGAGWRWGRLRSLAVFDSFALLQGRREGKRTSFKSAARLG
jgi:hypothetical protein